MRDNTTIRIILNVIIMVIEVVMFALCIVMLIKIYTPITPKQVDAVIQQSQDAAYDIDLAHGSLYGRLSNWTMLTQLSADAITGETIVVAGESHCEDGSYHVHIADGYSFAYELKDGKYPDDGTEIIVSGTIDLKEEEDGYGEYYVKDGVMQNVK